MARTIQRLGHRVSEAEDGMAALELLRAAHEGQEGATQFDVVFLDK